MKENMKLPDELRAKIRGRAQRAFSGQTVHRCTLEDGILRYRLPGGMFDLGLGLGPKIIIRRDKLGRIYVPRSADVS